jgi:hypothetical protein
MYQGDLADCGSLRRTPHSSSFSCRIDCVRNTRAQKSANDAREQR